MSSCRVRVDVTWVAAAVDGFLFDAPHVSAGVRTYVDFFVF